VLGPFSLDSGLSTSVARWRISSAARPARSRTWGIRRFADQAHRSQVRCRPASCAPGTSGSAAVVLELAMVRDEPWLQTFDAPAAPPAADRSRFDGCDGASMPRCPARNCSILLTRPEDRRAGWAKYPRRPGAPCAQEFCDSAARGGDPGLSSIAQQNVQTWINIRLHRAIS
jgi:hypothetical protein